MTFRSRTARRGGVASTEAALVVLTFLTIILGMIDLGNGVFRYKLVSQLARQGARQAIVHGSQAPAGWQGGPCWPATHGPVALNGSAAPEQALAPYASGLDTAQAQLTVTWLDGNNQAESRVRVTVTCPYQPIMTFIFGNPTYTLTATSTMTIAH